MQPLAPLALLAVPAFSFCLAVSSPHTHGVASSRQDVATANAELPNPELAEQIETIRRAISEGDRDLARTLLAETVASLGVPTPRDDDTSLGRLLELDGFAQDLGSLRESLRLREGVFAIRERLLPADQPELLAAKQDLGTARARLGDFVGASKLFEEVLAVRTRLLPADDPDLLAAKQNLALTMQVRGDLVGARVLQEEALEAWTRIRPADHPALLCSKQNLAVTKHALRDLQGARELLEDLLAAWTRLGPADHPELLLAKQNLAALKVELDDFLGARELCEEVLAARMRILPPDHPELLAAKLNLAATKHELGDLLGARELSEEVLAAWTRLGPANRPDLFILKMNLAQTRSKLGDLAGARELGEQVLAAWTGILPPEHPNLVAAKQGLAMTKSEFGDHAGARELLEEVLTTRARTLPPEHPDVHMAKHNLAVTKAELGDISGMRELVSPLLECQRTRARSLRAESPRVARAGARTELERLSEVLFLSELGEPQGVLAAELFAALESLRHISIASSEVALALVAHTDLEDKQRSIAALRGRLNDLAALGPGEGANFEDWRKELTEVAQARDRLEWEMRSALVKEGVFLEEIDASSVAGALAPDAVAVSFLRYPRRLPKDPQTGRWPVRLDSLVAFLVRPKGEVLRVELGSASELEELVEAWRQSIGKPVAVRIGIELCESEPGRTSDLGERLRKLVLDPLLALAPEAKSLHVVADDILYLVPLDALPCRDALVGDRLTIRNEVSFGRLVHPPQPSGVKPALLIAGAIDYGATLSLDADPRLDAATPPVAKRSGAAMLPFPPLLETQAEMEAIADLFLKRFQESATLLCDQGATKAGLAAQAPSARFLHLATHGWFAPEPFRSQIDEHADSAERELRFRAAETVKGFAPETLCGLALAGANRGRNEIGRVPGILTAEELSSLDLRNCELAVLSACETNVGIRRAGQGIQSLQAALHAAGARTAVTSIWRVSDAATRLLMADFYRRIWSEKQPKAEALWAAKVWLRSLTASDLEGLLGGGSELTEVLRDLGSPVEAASPSTAREVRPFESPKYWAGWALSGDPD